MEIVCGKPGTELGVGDGEFAMFGCACGFGEVGGSDAGFVKVGEGGEQSAGETDSVVDWCKIFFGEQVEGDATAKELEAEMRGDLRLKIGKLRGEVGDGGEADVDVALWERTAEVKGEEAGWAKDVDWSKWAELFFVGGDLGSKKGFEVLKDAAEKFAWRFGWKIVSCNHGS